MSNQIGVWSILIQTTYKTGRVEFKTMLKRHNELISDVGFALRRPILKRDDVKQIVITITPPTEG